MWPHAATPAFGIDPIAKRTEDADNYLSIGTEAGALALIKPFRS